MKNNFKFLIVLAILLAGCICIGSTFAADPDIDVTDVSVENTQQNIAVTDVGVDNTQQNIEIAHDDSSTKNDEIPQNFKNLANEIDFAKQGTHELILTNDYKYNEFLDDDKAYQEGIEIGSLLVIDGKDSYGKVHTIDGSGLARIFNIKADRVIIKNIIFINTASDNGGAISYYDSPSGLPLTIEGYNITFINCTATNNGGAIYSSLDVRISGSNISFINCTATNNGGAIYSQGGVKIEDSSNISFIDNTASNKGNAIYSGGSLDITGCSCNSTDDKAPIYNDGTILSPVEITTIDGETKEVTKGEVVNLTGIITACDMRVAGGVLTLTINGTELNATSDETGLYSKEYTVDFIGTKPVNAIYNNSTKDLQSLVAGNINSSSKITPDLSIKCNDSSITYGDLVTVDGEFAVSHEEVNVNGTVFLYDNNTIIANKTINNAIDVKFDNLKLAAGTHGFKLVFISSDEIYGDTNSTVINPTVDKATPYANIDIIPEEIIYGDDVTVIVTLPDDATGNVTIIANDQEVNVTVVNGSANATFKGLNADIRYHNNTVKVIYSGDDNYNMVENSTTLPISPKPIDISAIINNITYGDGTTTGVVNASMNGTVTITFIPGTKGIPADVNESGEFTIPLNLPAGMYNNVHVSFLSTDGNYMGSTRVNITINPADPQVLVDIGSEKSFDIKFGDTVVAIVDVPDDATGTISFSLDNDTWITKPIPEDTNLVEWDIPDLDARNYILFVKYSGDSNYNPVYSENPFSVDQLKTIVTVDPVKGKVGEKVKITARVTDERGNPVQEGTVTFRCMNIEFKAEVVDGIATIVTVLPNATGTYNADAFYEGSNYESSSATFTVEVSDIPGPNPNPNPKKDVSNPVGNMENTGNPLFVLLIALAAIGLESLRRKF